MATNYVGIDYSLGKSNFDPATGIHFGVISQNDILQAWADSNEADYGDSHCPVCGNDATKYEDEKHGEYEHNRTYGVPCADYACESCKLYFDSEDVFSDEPSGYHLDDGEYRMTSCLDSDVMILRSPYYTFTQFCSPCVPGAGNLNTFVANGVKTYCVSHDWFDDGKAPYPVYRISDNTEVLPA